MVAVPEVHVHFPAHFNVGESYSIQVKDVSKVVPDMDQEAGEPSPSVFKTEADYPGWEF